MSLFNKFIPIAPLNRKYHKRLSTIIVEHNSEYRNKYYSSLFRKNDKLTLDKIKMMKESRAKEGFYPLYYVDMSNKNIVYDVFFRMESVSRQFSEIFLLSNALVENTRMHAYAEDLKREIKDSVNDIKAIKRSIHKVTQVTKYVKNNEYNKEQDKFIGIILDKTTNIINNVSDVLSIIHERSKMPKGLDIMGNRIVKQSAPGSIITYGQASLLYTLIKTFYESFTYFFKTFCDFIKEVFKSVTI